MSKHLTPEELALYVDGIRLSREAELPEEIRYHAAGCEQCKRGVLDLLDLAQDLVYAHEEPHPYFDRTPEPGPSAWQTTWRVAAVLVIALGLGTLWYLIDPPGRQVPELLVEFTASDSTPTGEPQRPAVAQRADSSTPGAGDLAARFEESPNLEDLVGMPLRSGSSVLWSPRVGASVFTPVRLSWQSSEAGPFGVSILDHSDTVVFDTLLTSPEVLVERRLEPGLYYWRLVAGGRLQFVSKFFVGETAPSDDSSR